MQSVRAAGTPYTLTQSPAYAAFGTTSPQVTLPANVRRAITARVVIDMSGCTLAGVTTVTLKLRKTNGTPGDIAASITTVKLGIIGTSGTNEVDVVAMLPQVIVTSPTAAQGIYQLWASVDALPSAGVIQIREASILVQ
jgi:hypothetical protein